jgi:hypothetical protein
MSFDQKRFPVFMPGFPSISMPKCTLLELPVELTEEILILLHPSAILLVRQVSGARCRYLIQALVSTHELDMQALILCYQVTFIVVQACARASGSSINHPDGRTN